MSATDKVRTLQGELAKTLGRVAEIEEYHAEFRRDFPPVETPRNYDLVLLADLVTDYYTCLETGFVRISKLFENHVDPRWHKSLLERMALEIPAIRARVLAEDTFACLDELMRFRHFRRYYFDRRYERERMALLEKTFLRSLPLVRRDLAAFLAFLEELARQRPAKAKRSRVRTANPCLAKLSAGPIPDRKRGFDTASSRR